MRRCRPKGGATQQEEDMQHLDEGTIHAWLDGQLPQDEAQQVEAHVAECRQCADAVAEARGLIAASSRILTALDGVPGEVVPKPAPLRTEAETARASAIADAAADAIVPLDLVVRRAPRRWFNGASLAAAAAIVVGIGTVGLMQRAAGPIPAAMERTVSSTAVAGRAVESAASAAPVASVAPARAADSVGVTSNIIVGTPSVAAPKRAVAIPNARNEGKRFAPNENAAKKEAESQRFAAAVTELRDTTLNRAKALAANTPADELAKDTKQQAQSAPQPQAPPRREALTIMQSTKADSARLDRSQATADAGVATGGLKGRVIDANDTGLAGASVSVEGTTTAVVTNTAGEFAISGLQGGAHRLNVRRVGYQPVNRNITVTPGQTLQTDVVLNASQTALKDAVVTSAAGAAPGAAAGARAKTAPAPAPSVDSAPGAPITAEQSNAVGCYDLGITTMSVSRNGGFRQVPRRVALDSEIVPANADGVWYRARDLARANPLANGLWRPSGTDAIELEFTYGSRTARIRVAGPPGAMMRGSLEEIDRATATGDAGTVVAVRRSCEP
jgi:anti-sigma factor RsiW